MSDSVAIVSGGMDSVTLLHYLVKQEKRSPAVITFIYGQKHNKEVEFAKAHASQLGCADHLVLDLSLMRALFANSALVSATVKVPDIADVKGDPQPATYVPNRNMIFLALAAAYAETQGVSDLFYGAQRHDMNRKTPVNIKAPFVDFSKTDILRTGLELEVDYGMTWSCYEGQDAACGRCPTCGERMQAFADLGISDPLPYAARG
jgi:7-cyano-7-deazaguanine synthase